MTHNDRIGGCVGERKLPGAAASAEQFACDGVEGEYWRIMFQLIFGGAVLGSILGLLWLSQALGRRMGRETARITGVVLLVLWVCGLLLWLANPFAAIWEHVVLAILSLALPAVFVGLLFSARRRTAGRIGEEKVGEEPLTSRKSP